jgi:hypothetical protein
MAKPKIKFEKHIRKESRAEVRKIAEEYQIEDSGGLLLLQSYAECDTTERNCQDIVNEVGFVVKDRFDQVKSHPLLVTIRDARAQKLACLKALCLDVEPLKPVGRPGGR